MKRWFIGEEHSSRGDFYMMGVGTYRGRPAYRKWYGSFRSETSDWLMSCSPLPQEVFDNNTHILERDERPTVQSVRRFLMEMR